MAILQFGTSCFGSQLLVKHLKFHHFLVAFNLNNHLVEVIALACGPSHQIV